MTPLYLIFWDTWILCNRGFYNEISTTKDDLLPYPEREQKCGLCESECVKVLKENEESFRDYRCPITSYMSYPFIKKFD